MNSFFGTEAALIFAMLAYNLMALFRQFILNSKVQHTLSTLRYKTFAIGAYFQKKNNKYILKLSLNMKRREWFEGLWNHSNQVSLPFVFLMRNLGLNISRNDEHKHFLWLSQN
jgi:hypothetical protein